MGGRNVEQRVSAVRTHRLIQSHPNPILAVLSSENETDVVKRNVRACGFDFMIDVVPRKTTATVEQWAPPALPSTPEGAFLVIGGTPFCTHRQSRAIRSRHDEGSARQVSLPDQWASVQPAVEAAGQVPGRGVTGRHPRA